jgi:hypothetical protein
MWTNNDGAWDPERRKLHEKILKELFAEFGEDDQAAEPAVMFTVGGPGSGKSTAREMDKKLLDMPPNTLHLDNDFIKLLLPEYGKMTKGEHPDPYAAYATHDEAAEIMRQAVVEAIKRGIHVHIDGTGDDNPGEFEKRMTTFADANYKVRVTLFDTPTDLGIARTILGADARHGRWLSPNYVRETYEKVARSFLGWKDKGYIADWRMFSTLGERCRDAYRDELRR